MTVSDVENARPTGFQESDRGTEFPFGHNVKPDASAPVPAGGNTAFMLIDNPADLPPVIEAVRASERVGLDVETTGLNPRDGRLRLIQLATATGTFVIDADRVTDLSSLFAALAEVEVAGHNLQFELSFLLPVGFVPGRLYDTMLASQVLDAGDRTVKHTIAAVAARHLGEAVDKAEQKSDWSGTLTVAQLEYAALDAELPLRLLDVLTPKLAEAKLTATADLENRALPCVAWMGTTGVAVDRAAWQELAIASVAEAARLVAEMDALAPPPANLFGRDARNWNSTPTVQAVFAQVGVALESTDDDALAAIVHPLADLFRQYRSATKLAGTYGVAWLEHVAADGRVYPGWRQCSTMTGRMSCADPNLQQLPRDPRYRKCFVAPPGRALVKADYSQIELRLAAVIAPDDTMCGAYKHNFDLHSLTAASITEKLVADVTKADRQLAKAVNFGLLYGGGAEMLVSYAKSSFDLTITEAQAKKYRRAFFATYGGLRHWHNSQSKAPIATRTRGGRRRLGVASFTEKLNTPVQGSGADGLKAALALLWDRRHEHATAFPVLAVHDEIVVECDRAAAEAVTAWLVTAMTDGMQPFCVPVEVEATVAPTWGG